MYNGNYDNLLDDSDLLDGLILEIKNLFYETANFLDSCDKIFSALSLFSDISSKKTKKFSDIKKQYSDDICIFTNKIKHNHALIYYHVKEIVLANSSLSLQQRQIYYGFGLMKPTSNGYEEFPEINKRHGGPIFSLCSIFWWISTRAFNLYFSLLEHLNLISDRSINIIPHCSQIDKFFSIMIKSYYYEFRGSKLREDWNFIVEIDKFKLEMNGVSNPLGSLYKPIIGNPKFRQINMTGIMKGDGFSDKYPMPMPPVSSFCFWKEI